MGGGKMVCSHAWFSWYGWANLADMGAIYINRGKVVVENLERAVENI
jgi:hypothetical protein